MSTMKLFSCKAFKCKVIINAKRFSRDFFKKYIALI